MNPPADPTVTVVVCTRNRAELLAQCLGALAAQDAAPGSFEVVVVDNGSVDRTPALLAEWANTAARRTVCEPTPGLSRARNVGARLGTGVVIAFIDDDALADPGWVSAIASAFATSDAVGLAGRATLVWRGMPPRWITPALERWYSAFELGDTPRELVGSELPIGVNMAVLRTAFEAVSGFDEDLGRVDADLASSEDDDLFLRVRAKGGRLMYQPSASVRHLVADERGHVRWLVRRAYAEGRSNAVMDRKTDRPVEPASRTAPLGVVVGGWLGGARRMADAQHLPGGFVHEIVSRAARMGYVLEGRDER